MRLGFGRHSRLLLGVAAAVAAAPGVTLAQESTMEEVVVTARKRAETLQEVPLAVSVLDATSLQDNRIEAVDDLYGRVPGLYFTQSGGAAPTSDFVYIVLRGVGFNGGQEPSAGVFIDGMYQPQLGFDIGFLDLERVEVLRGPQGTLFGRNTQAGAVNLVTRKPDENLTGRVEAELAEFNTYRIHGTVNGPLADNLFGGISAEYGESDGYLDNPLNGGRPAHPYDRYSARGTLRWLPTDNLELVFAADVSERGGNEIALGSPLQCECYDAALDNDRDDEKNNKGVQLTAEWKASDFITVTSITGWREADADITIDFDGEQTDQTPVVANGRPGSRVAPGPITVQGLHQRSQVEQRFWSEELRVSGESERVDWLVGAYYFDQTQDQKRAFDIGPGIRVDPSVAFLAGTAIREDFDTDRDGWALFGQASWRMTDRLELTGGTRYSRETVSVGGERLRNITLIENANPTFFTLDGEDTFSDVSSMVSLSFEIDPSLSTYATLAQGWKAGGFTRYPSTENAVLPYDSETSTNYEIGLKGAWPAQRLTANLALFYIDIEDQQLLTVTPDSAGVPVTTITNAGKSRSQGAELEFFWGPMSQLDLSLSFAYTDAEFTDFTQMAAGGASVVRDGQPFEYVPEITGSATVEYRVPVFGDHELALNANYRYVDEYIVPDGGFTAALGSTMLVEAYDRLDLRATLKLEDWKVSAFVRNVLDSFDYTNISYNGFVDPTPADFLVIPLEPRTFGLVVTRSF
jgi:iron complex outermembrane receptor protein